MMASQPIGLANTGVPVALLAAGAAWLPRLLAGRTLSQARLAMAVALTALLLIALGAGIFALLYALEGAPVARALAGDAVGLLSFFFGLSLRAALFWAPVLALVWYVLAQGVERRRGEAIANKGDA